MIEVKIIFTEQLQTITTAWQNRWTRENIESFAVDFITALAVLALAYIIIKLLHRMLDKVLRDNTSSILSDNFIRSLRALLKTLVMYGSYFLASIFILEIFDVSIITSQDLKEFGVKLLKIVGVLAGAKLLISFGQLAVRQAFQHREANGNLIDNRRAQTMEALLGNVLTYIIFFLAAMMVLQIFNVNTSAILASAGILGLAVGFGAQNLVKDVISGFFILFEDQLRVGDYVETAGVTGVVEEIGLRTCKIRAWTGQLHIIPNGEINKVTNYNRGHMMAVVTLSIAYEENIDQALEVLRAESQTAKDEIQTLADVPVVQGITDLADSSVNIRIIASTLAGEQWAVERELRRRYKNALDRAGIEIPYPRMVLLQHASESYEAGKSYEPG